MGIATASQVVSATYAESLGPCQKGMHVPKSGDFCWILAPTELFALVERDATSEPGCLWTTFSADHGIPERLLFDCAAWADQEHQLVASDVSMPK